APLLSTRRRRTPRSTLFPYTTLFRSLNPELMAEVHATAEVRQAVLVRALLPTLRDTLGHNSAELRGADISLEGMKKAVSQLRQELGRPDPDPPGAPKGQLSNDEERELL